jgi:hypothetical protein
LSVRKPQEVQALPRLTRPWNDVGLATRLGGSVENFALGQRLLDEVAADLGVPATPGPRWWEST